MRRPFSDPLALFRFVLVACVVVFSVVFVPEIYYWVFRVVMYLGAVVAFLSMGAPLQNIGAPTKPNGWLGMALMVIGYLGSEIVKYIFGLVP